VWLKIYKNRALSAAGTISNWCQRRARIATQELEQAARQKDEQRPWQAGYRRA